MAKRNIAKGLIKQPIDLRSQKARRKNSGQPIGNIIGDPLAAGYFSNGDPNRDVEGGGLINHPGQAQPYPGNTFTDESYQPPAFNPCPVGYTQNPGATGDYDDPYCIPSTNMPGGEWTGGNAYDPGGFGMAVDPSGSLGPSWFDNPALNEGIEYTWNNPTDPSTQPGFGSLADAIEGPLVDMSGGAWTGGNFISIEGMDIDPEGLLSSNDFDTFTEGFNSWADGFGTLYENTPLDTGDPETACHYAGMSIDADGECAGEFYTPSDTPDDWDEDYCWNGNNGCDCTFTELYPPMAGTGVYASSWTGCGESNCEGLDCADTPDTSDEEEEEIAIAACQDQGLSYNSNWGGDGIGIGCFDEEALSQWAGANGYISSGNWLNQSYAFCHWQGLSVDADSGNCCDEAAGLCP